jgi:hypothetical protein
MPPATQQHESSVALEPRPKLLELVESRPSSSSQSLRLPIPARDKANTIFWSVLLSATLIKIVLALCTFGSNDVLFFKAYAEKVQSHGPLSLYREGVDLPATAARPPHHEFFAHPPFIIYLLYFLNAIQSLTGLPFQFLFRMLSILADIGSALLLRQLLAASADRARANLMACLFAGAPLLMFLSGFHGNTDPVMCFFLVLCVWLLSLKRIPWLAGLAFGMSCNIKVWPLILAPVFFFYILKFRHRVFFSIAAGSIFLLGCMPFMAQDRALVMKSVFGYGSLFGHWGLSWLLSLTGPDKLRIFYAEHTRDIMLGISVVCSFLMGRKRKANLLVSVGVVASMFLTLTPGFGIQYLSWLLPWTVMLGPEVMMIYLVTTGLFMFHVYTFWSGGFPWYLADSLVTGTWRGFMTWHEIISWFAVVLCFGVFLEKAGLLEYVRPAIAAIRRALGKIDWRTLIGSTSEVNEGNQA